jgi:histone-lysine N-methyltransferase EZH2
VARSDIQGWGLFILEKAAKNDLILEYTGEVISHNEAERRGVLYDRFGCSYLFNLNKESVVDSTRMGNIAKFVNHSDRNDRNCYPCIKIVDGTHRIGLYAKRPIEAGEELTFDYQYTKETAPAWAEPRAQKRSRSSRPPEKKARVMH